MSGRFFVVPSRSGIMRRAIGYGAAWGAGIGAVVAMVPAAFFPPALLPAAVIAGAVGAFVGMACGLAGGLGLVICRNQAGTSRPAVCVVAGAGAGLPPATLLVVSMVSSGHRWLAALAGLTLVVVATAAALGPKAFYGKPPPRKRPARRPSSIWPDSPRPSAAPHDS